MNMKFAFLTRPLQRNEVECGTDRFFRYSFQARRLRWVPGLTVVFALGGLPAMRAVAAPDAGALQQQIERDQARPLPQQGSAEVIAPPAAASPKRGNTLVLKGFKFKGNTLLGAAQLEVALEPYRQKPLDFAEIDGLCQVLAAFYRAQGFLASVVLPAQDVSDGVVTFVVVEATVGKVVTEPQADARTDPQRVQALVAAQLPQGQVFSVGSLDRALLLANDLPGVAVTGALAEGEAGQQTDLVLHVVDKPLWSGDATLDNGGGRSTGVNRVSLNGNGNGVLGLGDLWSASALVNQGSTYFRLGLTAPLGFDGLRLGTNISSLQYRIADTDYSSQHLEGSSGVLGLEATYPLVRTPQRNLYVSAALDDKRFLNYANGAAASDYASRAVAWSLYGNRFDDFAGGGSTSGNLTLTQGRLALDNYPNHAADASTVQTAGDYRKLRYGLSRLQFIAQDLTLLASLSSEKFGLGGSTGVRAYPGGEGSGAIGQLWSAELRWRWNEALALSAFYDTGSVTINARNNYPGASALNAYSLSGGGLALDWQWERIFSAKLTWARRTGSNPNPAANGNDQDGTLVQDRLWASASLAF
jgi:hemolysin activation/secretion protein